MIKRTRKYIHSLREKPEDVRKRAVFTWMIVSVFVVGGTWYMTLSSRFSSGEVVAQAKNDVKPFSLLGTSLRNTYKNITASVGSIGDSKVNTEAPKSEEKIIDLIPVER